MRDAGDGFVRVWLCGGIACDVSLAGNNIGAEGGGGYGWVWLGLIWVGVDMDVGW